jgi:TRAP-type C4-dicarboxylate transport system permease small subunit
VAEPEAAGKRRAEKKPGRGGAMGSTKRIRSILASVVWLAAVVCALALAVGALMIALQLNQTNSIVKAVLDVAQTIDFGVFKEFEPNPPEDATRAEVQDARQSAITKSVMVNWGLAALIYLVVGKVLDRIIRPRS